MDIEIKPMTLNDLDAISNTLISDFDDFWTYAILKDELECKNSHYIVAKLKTKIIGFAGIKVLFDEADIMNIVTKKSYRKKGIGSILLQNLIDISRNLNLTSITLEVHQENLPAITLYKKFSFEEIGLRKNYYKDKNGIIMMKKI